jgi:hypothetical protein
MNERISDIPIREDKVKRLKVKVLSEIEKELNATKEELKVCTTDGDDDFDFLVKRSFALLNLREYIMDGCTFMDWVARYPIEDMIIYKVSDECLNVWLQDDYHFVWNFLHRAEEYGYDVFSILNDEYFGREFTNIFDFILHEKKMKEQKEANMDD